MSDTVPATPVSEEAPAQASNLPAVASSQPLAPRAPIAFDADDPVSLYMNSGVFEQLQRVARMMAKANLVPAHLRGGDDKVADCFLVAAQAFRWRMDPFSVAQHTFVTSGKLGYEGKLIAGLINASGKLKSNLKPSYSGEGNGRKVVVSGQLKSEAEPRTIEGTVGQWKTNNDKWVSMPDQMLFYRGAREWARRHMPEVLLGISAEEEIGGETVELQRGTDGSFAAPTPTTPEELKAQLRAENAAPSGPEPITADPSATAQASPGPGREPGSDDDEPAPREAIEALTGAAGAQAPRKGDFTKAAGGKQRKLEE